MPLEDVKKSLVTDEKLILIEIARIKKTKAGYFSENKLRKKRKCQGMDVSEVLHSLQDKFLTSQVNPGKKLWKLTREGKVLEHELLKEEIQKALNSSD